MTLNRPQNAVLLLQAAKRFGTPMFFYDGDHLREHFKNLRAGLTSQCEIFYSLKANPNIAVFEVLQSEGARAEVCSLVELETAVRAGTAPCNIIFVGPGKSQSEIARAVELGIYALVCESEQELQRAQELAKEKQTTVSVALRVNPKSPSKSSRLQMGGKPRQFGMDEDVAESLLDGFSEKFPSLHLRGLHVYFGTRILDASAVVANTQQIIGIFERFQQRWGRDFEMLDIGGGLGVPYFANESELDLDQLLSHLNPVLDDFKSRYSGTRLIMELGRYLVADAGVFVGRVRYKKKSMGKNFLTLDGGTNCHMAAVGIGSFVKRNFPMVNLTPRSQESEVVNVTGPLCTPNDLIGKDVELHTAEVGDLIGTLRSGAYGPTASPVYFLSHGYPAEVLALDGQLLLVRKPDKAEDMLSKQASLSDLGLIETPTNSSNSLSYGGKSAGTND